MSTPDIRSHLERQARASRSRTAKAPASSAARQHRSVSSVPPSTTGKRILAFLDRIPWVSILFGLLMLLSIVILTRSVSERQQLEQAEQNLAAAREENRKRDGQLQQLREQLEKQADLSRPLELITALRTETEALNGQSRAIADGLAETEKKIERSRQVEKQIPAAEDTLRQTEAAVVQQEKAIVTLQTGKNQLEKQVTELSATLRFARTEEAAERIKLLESQMEALQKEIRDAEENRRQCKEAADLLRGSLTQMREHLKQYENLPEKDLLLAEQADLETEKKAMEEERQNGRTRLDTNGGILYHMMQEAENLEELEKKYSWMKALSDTANGNVSGKERIMLETYVQTTYFDRIINRANTRLVVMTGGQYDLKRRATADSLRSQSGLELSVIDHYNGTERSVKTLSGGESFKASLSLALGLSDEIQSSAGGIRLDTMFVDEGFGSLDEESLEQAMKALTGLTESNRLVGIISHVAELKERIDRQIVVTKDRSGGSRTKIV